MMNEVIQEVYRGIQVINVSKKGVCRGIHVNNGAYEVCMGYIGE